MADFPQIGKHRIGFVSTRFTGTDGVSLETTKWVEILKRLGNTCFFFAGASDHSPQISRIVPEASFVHPEVRAIQAAAFGARARPTALTRRIEQIKDYLKDQLYAFIRDFEIELLLPENVLAIPMNIPLGVALAELIAETGIITIAHHHDFFWERKQYLVNCVWDYLSMAFTPHLPSIHHVVINSSAGTQLDLRTGSSAWFVPNVMDFDHPPPAPDDYVSDLRATLGIAENEYLFLQPTRIVQRKGIEHAIELTKRIGRPARLVLSASADDEGDAYENRVKSFAALLDVPLVFASDIIRPRRGTTADGRKIYSLGDLYTAADLVTYPSLLEGFGNAFLEAVYYGRPIVVNKFATYDVDIKPKGFEAVEFDGYITDDTVRGAMQLLDDGDFRAKRARHNYEIATRHYSYNTLEQRLEMILADCFGGSA